VVDVRSCTYVPYEFRLSHQRLRPLDIVFLSSHKLTTGSAIYQMNGNNGETV
jgi:hypothetical protein